MGTDRDDLWGIDLICKVRAFSNFDEKTLFLACILGLSFAYWWLIGNEGIDSLQNPQILFILYEPPASFERFRHMSLVEFSKSTST